MLAGVLFLYFFLLHNSGTQKEETEEDEILGTVYMSIVGLQCPSMVVILILLTVTVSINGDRISKTCPLNNPFVDDKAIPIL